MRNEETAAHILSSTYLQVSDLVSRSGQALAGGPREGRQGGGARSRQAGRVGAVRGMCAGPS